jgi:endonuclease/exonuclease/phosphatase family metal-dependent hydrolase
LKSTAQSLSYRLSLWLALLTLGALTSPLISPADFWPAAFPALAIPLLIFTHFVFVAYWIFNRRFRYLIVPIGCILVSWGHIQRMTSWNFPAMASAEAQAINIMSYNVHGLRHTDKNQTVDSKEIAEIAAARDCDILCLQEFPRNARAFDSLSASVQSQTKMKYRYSDRNGNFVLFSAFPIVEAQTIYFPNRANGYQIADLKIGAQTVRILNIHLQSNSVSGIADEVARDGDLQSRKTWMNIRGMLERFKRAAPQRALQAESLARLITQSPIPLLVAGDLNDTPHSYTYNTLSKGLQDAFPQKGRGVGITYAGSIPALRIDYIFARPPFRILNYRAEKKGFSDHKAIWAKVTLPNEAKRD